MGTVRFFLSFSFSLSLSLSLSLRVCSLSLSLCVRALSLSLSLRACVLSLSLSLSLSRWCLSGFSRSLARPFACWDWTTMQTKKAQRACSLVTISVALEERLIG